MEIWWNLKCCPICLWQNEAMFQQATWRKLFHTFSTSWAPSCQWQITSACAWCCLRWPWQHALQPLALAAASVCVFLAVAHSCVFTESLFCLVFSKKFNIISTLFVHQSLTLPQKIDSREGLFWCKKGVVCECGKMNFYLKKPSFAPILGLFAARCSAFWC